MSSTAPPLPGPLHPPEAAAEGAVEVEAEAGDAAGCLPEEGVAGATTMEARLGVAAAAAVAGAVVAVAVGVAAAPPLDGERA